MSGWWNRLTHEPVPRRERTSDTITLLEFEVDDASKPARAGAAAAASH